MPQPIAVAMPNKMRSPCVSGIVSLLVSIVASVFCLAGCEVEAL